MSERQHDDKFWMVWGVNAWQPRCRHYTRISAEQEAERLARVSPGDEFVVLEAVAGFKIAPPPPPPISCVLYDAPPRPF